MRENSFPHIERARNYVFSKTKHTEGYVFITIFVKYVAQARDTPY